MRILKYLPTFLKTRLALSGKILTPRPPAATINLTDRCNSRCRFCNQWKNSNPPELNSVEMKKVLLNLREAGVFEVTFSGGEPLLRDDLLDLISEAKKLGYQRISVMSNGLLLSKSLAQAMIKKGLTSLGLSIDGKKKTHQYIRRVEGSYQKNLKNLKDLNELEKEGLSLRKTVAFTMSMISLADVEHILQIGKKFNVKVSLNLIDDRLYFLEGVDLNRAKPINDGGFQVWQKTIKKLKRYRKKHPEILTANLAALDFALKYPKDKLQKCRPCLLGFLKVYVKPNGSLMSGCWAMPALGNLLKESASKIFNSTEYKKRVSQMIKKDCPGCSCGYILNSKFLHPFFYREKGAKARA